jgi:hypothetical protein
MKTIKHLKLVEAKSEAKEALRRHLDILDNIEKHTLTNNQEKDEFLYLMSIPIIYAAWEGYFRIACSICLRRTCHRGKKIKNYSNEYSTLWLQRESFVESFLTKLFNSMALGKQPKKLNSGRYNALTDFTGNIKNWLEEPADHLKNFDDLVMTYSNINKEVTELNSKIIGFDISAINLGRLDDLLGRRNNIAHGGLIDYPKENTITELLEYTRQLLKDFHSSIDTWLATN